MASYRPEIRRAVINRFGHMGYYPMLGFRASSPGVFSEQSLPFPTLPAAFDQLEKVLRKSFHAGQDQIHIDSFVFTSLDEALRELRTRYGLPETSSH